MVPAPGAFNIFTAVDKNLHRFKRKVLSQGFSDQTLRAFEPTMLAHIDTFVESLTRATADTSDGWSQPVNMTQRCRWLQYDVMGEFGFGQSFRLQKSPDNRFLIDAVEATGFRAGLYVQYPALQNLKLDKLFAWRTLRIRDNYLRLMSELVKSRLAADKNSQNDLFSFVIDAKDPETGRGFTESELWAESRFLLIAGELTVSGADTSSTGLTGTFFYLSAYPECRQALASEIRATFKSYSNIRTGPQLAGCQYLRACVDEAMRMSPPISGTLWREVCGQGISVNGDSIVAGTDVGVNPYAFHHNEQIFPDSYQFKPERWIVSADNPKEAVEDMRRAFNPFSIGTRSCAGRSMAYMELLNTLARTIWQCDFRRAPGPLGSVAGGDEGDTKESAMASNLSMIMDRFKRIGPRISLYTPDDGRVSGQLIVICTWLGAARKHIAKYMSLYQSVAPEARILLVESDVAILISSYRFQRQAVQPAVSVILETLENPPDITAITDPTSGSATGSKLAGNEDHQVLSSRGQSSGAAAQDWQSKVLIHCFSNGGTNTVTQILMELQKRRQAPLPLAGLVLDSCPEKGAYWKSYNGMLLSFPKNHLVSYLLGPVACHSILILLHSWIALGNENPASLQRRTLLSDKTFHSYWKEDQAAGRPGRVCYLYSKADQTCDWNDVKDHAKDARSKGWLVEEVVFDESGHVAHLMKYEDHYSGSVERTWRGSKLA
ncbi:MAG: hypothetical protein Q9159_001900 [Coniocarpon cinnabarinum]